MSLSPLIHWGQTCSIQFDGQIQDKGTGLPMSYSSIQLIESRKGMITDSLGRFDFKDICPGSYHIEISHVGFEVERLFIELSQNTTQIFFLSHHDELLNEVVVHGENAESITQVSHVIGIDKIITEANNNLADIAANITGVSVVKNGPGISKPVIHGLYGNRVTILNNGIRQAGQRWGNDHAPEIDVFIADHLAVIKGVAGLEISGGSLGGVLQVHPGPIAPDPHIHGQANYIFQSNGLGHTLSSKIEKGGPTNQWRIVGTTKLIGDTKAPDYYLTNTGRREANLAGQWNRPISDHWKISSYYSLFHTEIGILKASHIGNLTDLNNAIGQSQPFNTKDHFSYKQEAPRQEVDHHLLVLESNHLLNASSEINFKYGGQFNLRKEFDIRRGGRSEIPALSMALNSQYFESTYQKDLSPSLSFKTGIQFTYVQNKNDNATTGRSPLIPDYSSYTPGGFFTIQKDNDQTIYEFGTRYDLIDLKVININNQNQIEREKRLFHHYSIAGGISRSWSRTLDSRINLGFAQRSPEVNEMYSDGLHQGVATYETGDPSLKNERSIKAIFSNDYSISNKAFIQAVLYAQYFRDYIYLRPEGTILTIRGAFPLFLYDQTDALLYGLDLNLTMEPTSRMKFNIAYAYLKGQDLSNETPLVFMPPNNIKTQIHYSLRKMGSLKNNTLSLGSRYTFEQDLVEGQDLIAPPKGYFLMNVSAGTAITVKNATLNIGLKIENLLNESYRDYLDRLRYFADASGINAVLTLNYKF